MLLLLLLLYFSELCVVHGSYQWINLSPLRRIVFLSLCSRPHISSNNNNKDNDATTTTTSIRRDVAETKRDVVACSTIVNGNETFVFKKT